MSKSEEEGDLYLKAETDADEKREGGQGREEENNRKRQKEGPKLVLDRRYDKEKGYQKYG